VAVIFEERRVTYERLWQEALAQAAWLGNAGVEADARVGLLGPNSVEFIVAYYGILARGAVVVPIPPMLVEDEVVNLLDDSGATLLLADAEYAGLARAAAKRSGASVHVLGATIADSASVALLPTPRHPLDPAVLFYTSGTTGRPKGAVLTHLNLVMNCFVNAFSSVKLVREDVALASLPLFHTFGQSAVLNATLLVAGKVVVQRRFDARGAIELMRRHGVTIMFGVPTMWIELTSVLRSSSDRPQLRLAVSGGDALPEAVLRDVEALFATTVLEGYGLSETSPTATTNQGDFGFRVGSIGHPIWGVAVEVARADRTDSIELVSHAEVGELVIRGHNVFLGYQNRDEDTRAAVVDGWFRTGDLGYKDADGFLYVVDRTKDVIIRAGFNVYPREIEEVLMRHPKVGGVAVIGIPDRHLGEEVLAVVVPSSPADPPTERELLDWAQTRIGAHKRPRLVRFVDELPLGPSRKVLKRELRARFGDGSGTLRAGDREQP
jgi:long-chain acyl-CoA synthetase